MSHIIYTKTALKNIQSMDSRFKDRIREGIENIPFGDIKKLRGYSDLYRLRIGDYRIIYELSENKIIIDAVLPRGSAYKGL